MGKRRQQRKARQRGRRKPDQQTAPHVSLKDVVAEPPYDSAEWAGRAAARDPRPRT